MVKWAEDSGCEQFSDGAGTEAELETGSQH